jgi:hypothetical protein
MTVDQKAAHLTNQSECHVSLTVAVIFEFIFVRYDKLHAAMMKSFYFKKMPTVVI